MKTQNAQLQGFIDGLKARQKAIEEKRRLEKANKEYMQSLNSMGVIILQNE